MSSGDKFKYEVALFYANEIIEKIKPICIRIEIAGSLRRKKPEVSDIELIAIPKIRLDMFGNQTPETSLDFFDWERFGTFIKNGHKYKQITLFSKINLDLFIVTPPAQFGIQFIIRTGPAEYSHKMVTPKKYGGFMPSNLHVEDGAVRNGSEIIPTPEEKDVYELFGIPYLEPELRRA